MCSIPNRLCNCIAKVNANEDASVSVLFLSYGIYSKHFLFLSFRNHDTLNKTIIQALSVAIAKLPKEISRSRHSNQHHQRRPPSLALPPTSIPTYMIILVLCHGGFPGDYHTHVLITRRPMCKPKDRHKPGIKISLRSSAHTSLSPYRHMALTHLKPEHYTSTWVPNTSPLSSLSRDVIAKHQEAITSGPTAPGSHGFPGHDTHPSADYPVPLPFG